MSDDDPRPVKVAIAITGRDGDTTTYQLAAVEAEEERTKRWGPNPLDVRFTFSDVEYRSPHDHP